MARDYHGASTHLPKDELTALQRKAFFENPRNIQIVWLLETGTYTLEQVAEKVNLTRERVRQIYKKFSGRNGRSVQKERTRIIEAKREAKREEWRQRKKLNCAVCGKLVTNREGSRNKRYCQEHKRNHSIIQRSYFIKTKCLHCGIIFSPWNNYYRENKFHSQHCYFEWVRKYKAEHPGAKQTQWRAILKKTKPIIIDTSSEKH